MYGDVVLGVQKRPDEDHEPFETVIETLKHERYHQDIEDTKLTVEDLKELVVRFKALVKERAGKNFPASPWDQLMGAVGAVFGSWMNDRAIVYRRKYNIPTEWGTAVNVQAMVYGNTGDDSGSGVAFTRNPANGAKEFYGEFLINAQGEDVVAGVRTPEPVAELKKQMPKAYTELERIRQTLERHFKDVQDFEFTIEDGVVYMLQTRNGKRTAMAALKFSMDMYKEKLIDWKTAVMRNPADQLEQLLAPVFDAAEVAKAQGDRDRPARRSRRGVRPDLSERRSRGDGGREGREGAARARRDVARRSARHDRRRRHPHRARRRVVARGAGGPADGQGLRLRRGRGRSRLPGAHGDRRRPDVQGRRLDVDRRHRRQGLRRPGQDRAVGDRRRPASTATRPRRKTEKFKSFQQLMKWCDAGDAHERAHQRRHARADAATRSRSAPSASACAAPSTCSSRATASTRCAR